jgi:hypothetical protein
MARPRTSLTSIASLVGGGDEDAQRSGWARLGRDPREPGDAGLVWELESAAAAHGGPQGAAPAPPDPRVALQERLNECWARLEDVVSELCALHEVQEDAIVERARGTIAAENNPADR